MKKFNIEDKQISEKMANFNFINYLARIVGDPAIIKEMNVSYLTKYFKGDRELLVRETDDTILVYITTSTTSEDACMVEAGYGRLTISVIKYRRIGNTYNQEGDLLVKDFKIDGCKLFRTGYAISLTGLNREHAKLTFFGDLSNLKEGFSIDVDPVILCGYGDDVEMTKTLAETGTLNLVGKKLIKGNNRINGEVIVSLEEDTSLFEQETYKR